MKVTNPINVYKPQQDFINWLDNAKRNAPDGQNNIKTTLDAFLDFKSEYYRQVKKEKKGIVLATLFSLFVTIATPIAAIALILLTITTDIMGDFIFVPIITLIILGRVVFVSVGRRFLENSLEIFTVVLKRDWMWSELYLILRDMVLNPLAAAQAGMSYEKEVLTSGYDTMELFHYRGQIDEFHTAIIEYPAGTQIHISSPSLSFGEEVFIINKNEIREDGHSSNLIGNIDHPVFASKYDVFCDDVKHAFSVLSLKRMELLSNNILGVNKVNFSENCVHIDIKKHFDKIEAFELTDKNSTTDEETFAKIINENANKLLEFRNAFMAVTKG